MNNLAGFHAFNGVQNRREQRTIIFHPISLDLDDYNTELDFFQVVFVLKSPVNGNENIALSLGLSN